MLFLEADVGTKAEVVKMLELLLQFGNVEERRRKMGEDERWR